ncbi:MAG: DNA primase [Elusimicrobiaceae bacterium]
MTEPGLIEAIRERVDIVELIREYVPSLKKAGRTYKARCPFHNEKTPSFTVNQDKGLFYCFGCQSGGDVFAFLMKIENLPFNEAAERLAKRAGLEWRPDNRALGPEQKERIDIKKALEFAAGYYSKALETPAGARARDYIVKRGLSAETVSKFMLGFSPAGGTGLVSAAAKAGYSPAILRKAGLVSETQQGARDYFRGRLMFPIIDHRGDIVAFGGRILDEGQPKYLNSPETAVFVKSRILYGLNRAAQAIRKTSRAVLLEGYMDVIACHQAGVENTIAPLGTSFGEGHSALLKRYAAEIVVLFDGDEAGIRAALRAGKILASSGLYSKIALLPGGVDPDDYVKENGAQALENLIGAAVDVASFHTGLVLKEMKMPLSAQDKAKAADILAETVAIVPDEIVRAEWIRETSERLGVTETAFANRVREQARSGGFQAEAKPAEAPAAEKIPEPPAEERDIVRYLLRYPQYIRLADNLEESEFSSAHAWKLLACLKLLLDEGAAVSSLASELAQRQPELAQLVYGLSVLEIPQVFDAAREITACAEMIKKARIQRRYREITGRLVQLRKAGQDAPAELLKEQFKLGVTLKSSKGIKE